MDDHFTKIGKYDSEYNYYYCEYPAGLKSMKQKAVAIGTDDCPDDFEVISRFIENFPLLPNEFFLAEYNLFDGTKENIVASGFFEDTGRSIHQGWVDLPIYRIKDEYMKK